MGSAEQAPRVNMAIVLIRLCAAVLLFFSLVYNEYVLSALFGAGKPFHQSRIDLIRQSEIIFLILGLAFLLISESMKRLAALRRFSEKPYATNVVLACCSVFLFFSVIELSIRPFVFLSTTLFVKDDEIGWRFRPNAHDYLGGVKAKINGKGLRGPELDYTKESGVKRILFLGDSVTFGFRLERDEDTFPSVIQAIMQDEYGPIETINAGVGGYSPWQEHIYLTREGIKYEPDLVVLSFVLNDVTEKLSLVRFGGDEESFQLLSTASNMIEKAVYKSALMITLKQISYALRLKDSVYGGALEEESLSVESMARNPNRPNIERAWDITLENVGKIFDYCEERDIPVLLVIFPFTFQFDDIAALSAPQETLHRYAAGRAVPTVDLLPLLHARLKEQGKEPSDYFVDADHLSPLGSQVVSRILVNFILERKLLDGGIVNLEADPKADPS